MAKKYFDKFITDQIERAERNQARREERIVEDEQDLKRKLLRRYREKPTNLIYRNRKIKNG